MLHARRFSLEGSFGALSRGDVAARLRACGAHVTLGAEHGPGRLVEEREGLEPVAHDEPAVLALLGHGLSLNDRLVRLRAALHEPERGAAWWAVCEVLELWPRDSGLDDGLRYALDHTRGWAPSPCAAPRAWVARALDGEREPRLALARTVSLEGQRRDAARVGSLLDQLGGRVSSLSLADMGQAERLEGVAMLVARRPRLDGLRELDLRYTDFSDPAALLCSAATHLATLERVDARWTSLTGVGRDMMLRSSRLEALREVAFTVYGSSLPGRPAPINLPTRDST